MGDLLDSSGKRRHSGMFVHPGAVIKTVLAEVVFDAHPNGVLLVKLSLEMLAARADERAASVRAVVKFDVMRCDPVVIATAEVLVADGTPHGMLPERHSEGRLRPGVSSHAAAGGWARPSPRC